ncbi:MAG: hypothetical protein ACTHJP_05400 [Rhodanobacteraceae bacterium]
MKQADEANRTDAQAFTKTSSKQTRSLGARKTTGKRVTKSGDSGKGTTRKSDIRKADRAPKPAIKRSSGTKRSPPGGRA